MKNCPVCQKVVTDQAKFCFFCGSPLLDVDAASVVPAVDPEPEPIEAPIPEAEPAPEPAPEPIPAPEPVSEPKPDPIPEPAPVYVPEPEPEPAPQPEPVYRSEPTPAPQPEPVYRPEPTPAPEPVPVEPKQEQPIVVSTDSRSLMTTPGYIFTTILFHIPLVGLIFMIIWGCGKTKNLSRKRFSLACLIMRLLGYIFVLAVTVFLLICFSGVFPALWNAVKPILFP